MTISTRTLKWLATISRVILATTFIISGFSKVVDPWGTSLKVEEYLAIYHFEELLPLSMAFSIWLCGAELMMGCMLMCKVRIRLISIFAVVSMFFFTLLSLLSATLLPVEDCGCFGDAIKLTPWETFFKNLVLLPMAAIVWYRYRPDRIFAFKPTEIALTLLFFTISMGIGIHCVRHLPLVDFLPYKLGLNLREARLNPDKESVTEDYESMQTILIYRDKRSGKLQEFTLEDSEWQDESRWEWVETKTNFETPSIRPIIGEFALRTADGDVTAEILETNGKLILLCVNRFSKVRKGCESRFAELIKRAESEGSRVYCITPDRIPDSGYVIFGDARPVKCCNIDVHTVKTLLRANNGMVELTDGVITDKRNCRDIGK